MGLSRQSPCIDSYMPQSVQFAAGTAAPEKRNAPEDCKAAEVQSVLRLQDRYRD